MGNDGEERQSKIVFIGKDLPKDRIRNGFKSTLADENSVAPTVGTPSDDTSTVETEQAPDRENIEKRLQGLSTVLGQVKSGSLQLPDELVGRLEGLVHVTITLNQSSRTEEE